MILYSRPPRLEPRSYRETTPQLHSRLLHYYIINIIIIMMENIIIILLALMMILPWLFHMTSIHLLPDISHIIDNPDFNPQGPRIFFEVMIQLSWICIMVCVLPQRFQDTTAPVSRQCFFSLEFSFLYVQATHYTSPSQVSTLAALKPVSLPLFPMAPNELNKTEQSWLASQRGGCLRVVSFLLS